MIRFQVLGVRFSLPLLTLLFPILATALGLQGASWALLLALGAHELAHLAAAKLLKIPIREIRLMPFGGSAQIENPYRLPPGRLIPLAAAGPAANLIIAVIVSACAHWNMLLPHQARMLVQPNLILCIFNLIPALPLDGGRMLFAALSRPLGQARALNTGIWAGRVLSTLLLFSAIHGGLRNGVWNLTLILAAIFIICSEHDERSALSRSRAADLKRLLSPQASPARISLWQADVNYSARRAILSSRPGESAWFLLTRNGQPEGMIDSRSILLHCLNADAPDIRLGELPFYSFHPKGISGASEMKKRASC